MKIVTLDVRSRADTLADIRREIKAGGTQNIARISFTTPELLWKVLTAKRWELLKTLCGRGVVGIREAARQVDRDVKAVHSDITALVAAGILNREEKGVEFPYDAVRVEFVLKASEPMQKTG